MTVTERLRRRGATHRLSSVVAPPPEAEAREGESLAERYRRMANEGYEPRLVDRVFLVLDKLIAATALVLLSLLMALIAVAIRLDSGGPVLYRGLRVGREGACSRCSSSARSPRTPSSASVPTSAPS